MNRKDALKKIEKNLLKNEIRKKEEAAESKKKIQREERQEKVEINKAKHKAHHGQSGFPQGKQGSLAVRKGGQR